MPSPFMAMVRSGSDKAIRPARLSAASALEPPRRVSIESVSSRSHSHFDRRLARWALDQQRARGGRQSSLLAPSASQELVGRTQSDATGLEECTIDVAPSGATSMGVVSHGANSSEEIVAAVRDPVLEKMAYYGDLSENSTSWIPLIKLAPTFLGKVLVAIGADLFTLGLSRKNYALVGGGSAALACGVGMAIAGALAYNRDLRLIDASCIRRTNVYIALGIFITSAGLTLGESDWGARSLWVRSLAAAILVVGVMLVGRTLPSCFAYSELVHGNTRGKNRRSLSNYLITGGLGLTVAPVLTRGFPNDEVKAALYPFVVPHLVTVLGATALLVGACIGYSNEMRGRSRRQNLRQELVHLARQSPPDTTIGAPAFGLSHNSADDLV